MAARTTMATLITKVRALTNATASDFSDDLVQAFLDRHRVEFRYRELCAIETRAAGGGAIVYKTFELEGFNPRMIEGNEGADPDAYSIVDNAYNALAPTTEDLINGRWTFAAEPTRPVMITCWAYDVYAAAVDLLEEWAAKRAPTQTEKVLKSVTDNGQTFSYEVIDADGASLAQLVETYRTRMCVESSHLRDTDCMPWSW